MGQVLGFKYSRFSVAILELVHIAVHLSQDFAVTVVEVAIVPLLDPTPEISNGPCSCGVEVTANEVSSLEVGSFTLV